MQKGKIYVTQMRVDLHKSFTDVRKMMHNDLSISLVNLLCTKFGQIPPNTSKDFVIVEFNTVNSLLSNSDQSSDQM